MFLSFVTFCLAYLLSFLLQYFSSHQQLQEIYKYSPSVPFFCPKPPFKDLSTSLSISQRNIVQLSSFPGSGNTWTRSMIEQGSGFLTGSIYPVDKSLSKYFRGEALFDGRRVIAIKTHYPCFHCFTYEQKDNEPISFKPINETGFIKNYFSTIQILRNPFDSILSYFNYINSGYDHVGFAARNQLESNLFDDFAKRMIHSWIMHTTFYLSSKLDKEGNDLFLDKLGKPVLLIEYDEMRKNPFEGMKRIFEFIKVSSRENDWFTRTINETIAATCAVQTEGPVYRAKRQKNRRAKEVFDPYTKKSLNGLTLRQELCELIIKNCTLFIKPFWGC